MPSKVSLESCDSLPAIDLCFYKGMEWEGLSRH